MKRMVFAVAMLVLVLAPVARAAENRHGAGFGTDLGTVEFDLPGDPTLDFVGFNVFGKIGITNRWGIFVNYRDMEDDENLAPGEEVSYVQIGVHGSYIWRVDKVLRPHVKFGVAWHDHEATFADEETLSDDSLGASIGGGFEAGSQRVAFFLDYELTFVEIELAPDASRDLTVDDLTVGVIFKF